jgi:hypothetical protein
VRSTGATGQQREGRRAGTSAGHGGDEVAAGRRSGWRGARRKGQRGREAGLGRGQRRVEVSAAGGGAGEELERW